MFPLETRGLPQEQHISDSGGPSKQEKMPHRQDALRARANLVKSSSARLYVYRERIHPRAPPPTRYKKRYILVHGAKVETLAFQGLQGHPDPGQGHHFLVLPPHQAAAELMMLLAPDLARVGYVA